MSVTAAFNASQASPDVFSALPVAASTIIYVGTLLAIDDSGNANPAADTVGLHVLGRCEGLSYTQDPGLVGSDADNSSGAAGAIVVNAKAGVFRYNNSVSNAITKAMIGQPAYVEDAITVASTTTHFIVAGLIVDVDSQGVWIDTRRVGAKISLYAPTQNALTDNSTGTAAAPSAGVRTIAAVSSTAAAANAIADLAAELTLVKADIAAILARLS